MLILIIKTEGKYYFLTIYFLANLTAPTILKMSMVDIPISHSISNNE